MHNVKLTAEQTTQVVDQIDENDGGRTMRIVRNPNEAQQERDRTRRANDRALRLEVARRMAHVRRLQLIVGRALVESGLAEEFDTALRS
jgi:hypothetical protein